MLHHLLAAERLPAAAQPILVNNIWSKDVDLGILNMQVKSLSVWFHLYKHSSADVQREDTSIYDYIAYMWVYVWCTQVYMS